VLRTLLEAGAFSPVTNDNLYYEMNMKHEHIPDVSQVGRDYYTYWWCAEFEHSLSDPEEHVWIDFSGINYLATFYVNGQAVVPFETDDLSYSGLNASEAEGQFCRVKLDVTEAVQANAGRMHRLAVLVEPPRIPGTPFLLGGGPPAFPDGNGQGGDHQIARNAATSQYVVGWDWVQPVADRNTGIWDRVTVRTTRTFALQHPWAKTSGDALSIGVDVSNVGGRPGVAASGRLRFELFDPYLGASVLTGEAAFEALDGGDTRSCLFPVLTRTRTLTPNP
jgi:hypothetical protein